MFFSYYAVLLCYFQRGNVNFQEFHFLIRKFPFPGLDENLMIILNHQRVPALIHAEETAPAPLGLRERPKHIVHALDAAGARDVLILKF